MIVRELRASDVERLDVIVRAAYGLSTSYEERLRRYVDVPTIRTLVADDGGPVGCVFGIDYGTVGYVALMSVDPARQRRGIASALFDALLAWGDARELPWLLDATPSGAALYAKSGFVDVDQTVALDGIVTPSPRRAPARRAGPPDLDAMAALDRRAFGHDRRWALAALLADARNAAVIGAGGAFAVAQHRGTIGPVVAPDAASAADVFDAALDAMTGRRASLFVPASNPAALDLVRSRGFVETRRLRHMRRGVADRGVPELLWGRMSLANG